MGVLYLKPLIHRYYHYNVHVHDFLALGAVVLLSIDSKMQRASRLLYYLVSALAILA